MELLPLANRRIAFLSVDKAARNNTGFPYTGLLIHLVLGLGSPFS